MRLTVLLLLIAAPLPAQSPGIHTTVLFRGGGVSHATPFQQQASASSSEAISSYALDGGRVLGAAVEVSTTHLPVALRLEYTRSASLTLVQEPGIGGAPLRGPASGRLTTATVGLLVEPRQTCLGPVCPRVLIGGGLVRYAFDAEVVIDDIIDHFAPDQDHAALQLGVGLRAAMRGIAVTAELSDVGSAFTPRNPTYPGKRTHFRVVSVGVGFRLP